MLILISFETHFSNIFYTAVVIYILIYILMDVTAISLT